jgi:hypothetical protein
MTLPLPELLQYFADRSTTAVAAIPSDGFMASTIVQRMLLLPILSLLQALPVLVLFAPVRLVTVAQQLQ